MAVVDFVVGARSPGGRAGVGSGCLLCLAGRLPGCLPGGGELCSGRAACAAYWPTQFQSALQTSWPVMGKVYAAGLHLWGSIDGVVWAIILLNTAAIYLTYLLAARTVGFPAAFWAALLMATSPEAVKYSVVVFNPVVMSFLGTCLFLALWRAVQRDRLRAAFWLLFLPLMMLQFHMSGLMLIPAIILLLWLKPARLKTFRGWLVASLRDWRFTCRIFPGKWCTAGRIPAA